MAVRTNILRFKVDKKGGPSVTWRLQGARKAAVETLKGHPDRLDDPAQVAALIAAGKAAGVKVAVPASVKAWMDSIPARPVPERGEASQRDEPSALEDGEVPHPIEEARPKRGRPKKTTSKKARSEDASDEGRSSDASPAVLNDGEGSHPIEEARSKKTRSEDASDEGRTSEASPAALDDEEAMHPSEEAGDRGSPSDASPLAPMGVGSRILPVMDAVEAPLKALNRLIAGLPVIGRPLSEATRVFWEQLGAAAGRR